MKAFCCLMFCLCAAAPVLAQGAEPTFVKKATVDLNGDGKADTITGIGSANNKQFTLTVNGIQRVVPHGDEFDAFPGFRVLALSRDSKRRYIVVELRGPNDYNQNYFFWFDGKTLQTAGVMPGTFTVPGNGAVYNEEWLAFWTCRTKYQIAPSGMLQFVPQAGYYVGASGTVKTTFPIRTTPTPTGATVASVAPGSKIELLLFQPSGKQPVDCEKGYYLIKTQTGLCGWAAFQAFEKKVDGLPFAG